MLNHSPSKFSVTQYQINYDKDGFTRCTLG